VLYNKVKHFKFVESETESDLLSWHHNSNYFYLPYITAVTWLSSTFIYLQLFVSCTVNQEPKCLPNLMN